MSIAPSPQIPPTPQDRLLRGNLLHEHRLHQEPLRPRSITFLFRFPDADQLLTLDEDPFPLLAFSEEPADCAAVVVPLGGKRAAGSVFLQLGAVKGWPCDRR